jgi:hypothetical protein
LPGIVLFSRFRAIGLGTGGLVPTIALIDDDRNILTSVSIALETEGYRIVTYTSSLKL